MQLWLSASATTPATLALMTAVGPPDWATRQFPTSSAMARRNERVQDDVWKVNERLRSAPWQFKFPAPVGYRSLSPGAIRVMTARKSGFSPVRHRGGCTEVMAEGPREDT